MIETKKMKPVCNFWLKGRCTRNPCYFAHNLTHPPPPPPTIHQLQHRSRVWKNPHIPSNPSNPPPNSPPKLPNSLNPPPNLPPNSPPKLPNSLNPPPNLPPNSPNPPKNESFSSDSSSHPNSDSDSDSDINNNKLKPSSSSNNISILAILEGHKKIVTGIALPDGSNKLYSGDTDGSLKIWDCDTAQCVSTFNFGVEVGSVISEGSWVFVGIPNAIKAFNSQTGDQFGLDGPVGQVYAMDTNYNMIFAGAQDGVISVWKECYDENTKSSSIQLIASLRGHTKPVVSLIARRGKRLYSGSMDNTIRVWDIDSFQCLQTLISHTDVVMSLLAWENVLISSSLDKTVKVWAAKEDGELEVIFSHNEDQGVVALFGMYNDENIPILYCSLKDKSVRLYELPSFAEKGRLFTKEEVRSMQRGPDGICFTGDTAGLINVWKWSSHS